MPQVPYDYNMPSLLFLAKSLYELSDLKNLRGITDNLIQETGYKQLKNATTLTRIYVVGGFA